MIELKKKILTEGQLTLVPTVHGWHVFNMLFNIVYLLLLVMFCQVRCVK